MSRSASSSKSRVGRLKALPWAALLQTSYAIGKRWRTLSEKERTRLAGLVRQSGGRPASLGAKERRELRRLVEKLDLKGLGRELLPLARGRRRGRRRSGRCRRP
jgi:hypothetical protein